MSEVIREKAIERERTVFITGATGFLGKYAVDEFLTHDYKVVAAGRNEAALESLEVEGVETVRASLAQLGDIEYSVDAVVNAAALSSPWGKWGEFHESNIAGTQHVIDFAVRNKVNRVVHVSSPSVYSAQRDRLNIVEDDVDTSNDLSYYIRSKIEAERLLQEAYEQGAIKELVILRPRGLLGVGDPSMIPRVMQAEKKIGIPLFNKGENIVDVTCVENVALALRLAVETMHAQGHVYNITNGEPRTFKSILAEFYEKLGEVPKYREMNIRYAYALAAALEKLCGWLPGNPEPPLTRYTVATLGYSQTLDISKAKSKLGYEPAISLSQGIAHYAAHLKGQHG